MLFEEGLHYVQQINNHSMKTKECQYGDFFCNETPAWHINDQPLHQRSNLTLLLKLLLHAHAASSIRYRLSLVEADVY